MKVAITATIGLFTAWPRRTTMPTSPEASITKQPGGYSPNSLTSAAVIGWPGALMNISRPARSALIASRLLRGLSFAV